MADFGRGRGQFEVLRFRLEEGEVKDFYKVIPVSIRMRGSFWDTLDFVDSMQNLLQLVNFSDLSMGMRRVPIAQTGGGGGAVQTNLLYTDFVASTYAYIEDSENKGGKG
ncbi:MAG: type 4a pilus biogenesis protein PilO [Nitrospinaceae bacterium]|nr:type 4a pilus biogenesis protein PilO [Nitrospinaceae bacterium]NIR54803.1 type 4a pilus biogenesis protein PilO [Nitrospinaceae bacterium]NIS85228.1 type 4a pilus biogenesis protein PilO [Nitrospinaceae bacterium]NIT82041.1 type 4a pilus biogenesis protein PilO [Nitrospinaceae bacterium]NIU44302.1 type 4a pilus biogenesis protein PilO [Nitrospinaceae bacterium]